MRRAAHLATSQSTEANSEESFDTPRDFRPRPVDPASGSGDAAFADERTVLSVCGFCATGCGLQVHSRDGHAVALASADDYPVNKGLSCPKGRGSLEASRSDDRATTPRIKQGDGSTVDITWDEALDLFVTQFRQIQEKFGQESIAFLSTGQITCEEMAFLGALAKFGMGLRHGDGTMRQCTAAAAVAYEQAFGFDAPPYSFEDLELSDCLVFIGTNPCVSHPVLWERVLRNQRSPEIIVLDPRTTETASSASQHLALTPHSDLAVLYAITQHVIAAGYVDEQFVANHTIGFERLREHVSYYKADEVAAAAGVPADVIRKAADTIGSREAASFWWTTGVNQTNQGARTAQAIINLALITGNIGRPGTGPNSLSGQCNAMGSRLWSNTNTLLGHHHYRSDHDRRKVADALQIDVDLIPKQSGWNYEQITEGIRQGKIRGLWVVGTNPAHSWIARGELHQLLDHLDFLVVQDSRQTTATARVADLLLPAASWGEKTGTFINSERRYGVARRVNDPPGKALPDFEIFRAIAERWGTGNTFASWTDPEAVFRILQRVSRGQMCDITGIDGYDQLGAEGGVQWPWTQSDREGGFRPETHRRLFSHGNFIYPDRLARLVVDDVIPHAESAAEYPLTLITGRGSTSQWHALSRVSARRAPSGPQPWIEMHPEDATALSISQGETVRVRSPCGEATALVRLSEAISRGCVFMPIHHEATQRLTDDGRASVSGQPSYKDCMVSVNKLDSVTTS